MPTKRAMRLRGQAMPTKPARRRATPIKPAKRRTTPTKPAKQKAGEFWVAKEIGPQKVLDYQLTCPGLITHDESSTLLVLHIYTKPLPYKGTQKYVQFQSMPFKFGLSIGPEAQPTSTGISISGHTVVCVDGWVCSNGQNRTCGVQIDGEVITSSKPYELKYSYLLTVDCGGVLTCIEKGTFDGLREDFGDSLDGLYYGTQTWTLECCSSRQTNPSNWWGK